MKKLVKNLLKLLLKPFPSSYRYIFEYRIIGVIPFPILFINWFFQRILRLNSKVSIQVNYTSRIINFKNIEFNKDSSTLRSFLLSGHCYFQALNKIILGQNILFAPGLKLISSNHDIQDKEKFVAGDPIVIGDNVWIGTNCVILPGIKIGDNVVIGAGSVVTKSFENNLIIAGNPARVIKKIE